MKNAMKFVVSFACGFAAGAIVNELQNKKNKNQEITLVKKEEPTEDKKDPDQREEPKSISNGDSTIEHITSQTFARERYANNNGRLYDYEELVYDVDREVLINEDVNEDYNVERVLGDKIFNELLNMTDNEPEEEWVPFYVVDHSIEMVYRITAKHFTTDDN